MANQIGVDEDPDDIFKDTIMDFSEESVCKKCEKIVDDDQLALLCDICDSWVHACCMEGGLNAYKINKKKFIWACCAACSKQTCVPKNLMDADPKKATSNEIMGVLKVLILQLVKANNISDSKNVENSIQQINQDMSDIKIKCDNYQSEISDLRYEVGRLKQDKMNNKAICLNIPKSAAGNNGDSFAKLLTENNIETEGKVGKIIKAKNSDKCNIIVEFDSPDEKFKFIKEIKEKKPKISDTKTLFVVECLSDENKNLLMEAKACLPNFKFKWTKNGRILVQKDTGGRAIWIKSSKMIQDMMKEEQGTDASGSTNLISLTQPDLGKNPNPITQQNTSGPANLISSAASK